MSKEAFTYFYGGPFSNWAIADFKVDGVKYVSAEQYMMHQKALLFGDTESAEKVMQTRDPQKAKIIGRGVRGFNKQKWEAVARDLVYKGCYAKFQQNEGFKLRMMETKGTTLVEASKTDQIWGIGLDEDDPRATDRRTWMGTNWLGEVLTRVRDDMDAGIYRTKDFGWSGQKNPADAVKVTNKTKTDLWIWDHDKMKRQAYDLTHLYDKIEGIEVVVRDSKLDHHDAVEVEIMATMNDRQGVIVATGHHRKGFAAPTSEELAAFAVALHKMKRQIHDHKEQQKTS